MKDRATTAVFDTTVIDRKDELGFSRKICMENGNDHRASGGRLLRHARRRLGSPVRGVNDQGILLIRPFAMRQYANDIAAAAILALKAEPFFAELEFRIVGKGRLFDEVTLPLRALGNVILDERFIPQAEIANLHRDHGLFLCPTRWDSQGVSRDEVMASGLVPLINDVAAGREFVDDECGVLAPPEDCAVLAAGVARLYREPDRFLAMSRASADRVRRRGDAERVVGEELAWVG